MRDTSSSIHRGGNKRAEMRRNNSSPLHPRPPRPPPPCPSSKRGERVSKALINYSELIHLPGASLAGFTEAPFFKTTTVRTTKGAAPRRGSMQRRLCN